MNYRLRDSSTKKKSRKVPLIILAAVVLALVATRVFAPAFSSRAIAAIFAPIMRSGDTLARDAAASGDALKSKSDLIAENAELKSELQAAQDELAVSRDLETENGELRDLLGLVRATKETPALVLSKPPLSPYDSLVIEIGSQYQVAAGDRVYADGDILLGEVAEADGPTAKVRLYSNAGTEIDAVIERTGVPQKVVGAGGGNFSIKAPKEVDVKAGDVLVVPSLGRKVLGVVKQVDSEPTDAFQQVLIKSPVNIFQLKWVTIESGDTP
ncbi:MAG TPA: rod shape-determining protein MreC [Candidatus Paceibacterota bacterium]|nr:rod shape-determining protein MreC [Candidatus Paceibacterota bacterium]